MKLQFEMWYKEKVANRDAIELFNEACICYKVGAYRASFIMTYLGFQNILKERLLKSKTPPQGIQESHWERTLSDLTNEQKWDEAVFDNVNRFQPSNPFLIDDDLRKKYGYFRCIRNDCAHAKSNIISSSHVETLWLFIQSNCNKFIINGGRSGLLERIKNHYNPVYTKPGSDITPIVEDILTSMNIEDIPIFLEDVYKLMKEAHWTYSLDKSEDSSDFWEGIVCSASSDLRNSLYKFVKTDSEIFLNFIDVYPDKLIELLSTSSETFKREFWNENIFKMFLWGYSNSWNVLEKIFQNNIIPSDEIDDFVKRLAKRAWIPPEDKIGFLKSIGYIYEMEKRIFGGGTNFNAPNGFSYANNNWAKIKFLLLNVDLDYEIVSQLNSLFCSSSFGNFHDGLSKLIKENEDFGNKYKQILTEYTLSVPECIVDLDN